MPGGYQIELSVGNPVDVGAKLNTTSGATLIPTGTVAASTKGTYTQLIASTGSDCSFMHLNWSYQSATAGGIGAVDVAIGTAGSEKIIIPDVVAQFSGSNDNTLMAMVLPIAIPAGTRIAARAQDSASTISTSVSNWKVAMELYDGAFSHMEGAAGVDVMGWSSPTATSVTPGNAAKGSWTQITASTARDYIGLFAVQVNNNADNTNFPYFNLDVGVGAAAAEQVLISNLNGYYNKTFISQFIPCQVAAGTRLSVRATVPSSLVHALGVVLYGVYQ